MKKQLTILSISCLLLLSKNMNAQAFEQGKMVFSVGYGFPNLVGTLFNVYNTYQDYNVSSVGPIFVKGEYAATDKIGVGLNIAYASTNVTYLFPDIDPNTGNTVNYSSKFAYNNLSILARVNWHFGESDKFDPYFGLGLGYRHGNYKFTTDDPNGYSQSLSSIDPFGFEVTVGARYFFTDNLAAYAELGFAKAPFQIGLAIKI